jgi:hypothetical protein
MSNATEITRSKRDLAILAALTDTTRCPYGSDNGDGFTIEVLDSGLIAVGYATGNYNGLPKTDGIFKGVRGFGKTTKLDSGESILYTEEGRAFSDANKED